ncbi:MAG: serine/threonine protein kinase, partial [Pyrinomonadaceae bacterium]|nr:serine/threonine protein kinase [Phycisphaerales bacterium]
MDQPWNEFDVFTAAATLEPGKRREFLRDRCPTPECCTRLLRLLEQSDRMPQGFLSTLPEASISVPEWIDEYEVLAVIGRGAMGVVYQAKDPLLRRLVAIKVLAPHLVFDLSADSLVEGEGRALAALRHPGIVEVYRLGDFEDGQYIAMQYVSRGTFSDWLERLRASGSGGATWTRPQIEDILRVMSEVAQALDHAHNAGIIHCDVKPSNILIDQYGHPVLTDFGVAQRVEGSDGTTTGRRGGTPPYQAPECSDPQQFPGRRSDIYSLGMVLYESLTGQCPTTPTLEASAVGPARTQGVKVRQRCPAARAHVEMVCRAALAKDPDHRYPTAGHMAIDLRACISGDPLLVDNPLVRSVRLFARKRRRELAAALISVLILVIAT